MPKQTIQADTVAEAYLTLLKDRGVDYLFGNAGTDFASIIEALSKSVAEGTSAPTAITVPHENLGVAMAHGYYLATGKPQAVMVHVNVGTANGICGVMNAARENVPILFTSGRTPLNEQGPAGARSIFIHWGQEMFDQAGTLREMVKWDYELRNADQLETVVDRAVSVAMTEPRGPAYLMLPREVLAANPGKFSYQSPTRRVAARPPAADPNAIDQLADWIAGAENPVIITASYGQDGSTVDALSTLAERFALPVIAYRPRYMCLPTEHPMHMGYEPASAVKDADVIVALDCDVPWIPMLHKINPDARVVHIGVDPLFSKYAVRGFKGDLAIASSSHAAVIALTEALEGRAKSAASRIDTRRVRVADGHAKLRESWAAKLDATRNGGPTDTAWVAHCIDQVKGDDDIVVSESQLAITNINFRRPGTFFGTGPAGGLGWGMGAALGLKLGSPERRVFSVVGDGAYMFGNPTPAHYVSQANDLPVLTVILNNAMWGAVRKATLGLHPDGAASRINRAPLTYLDPAPEYHKIVEASGGYGEEVNSPDDLPGALERAIEAVEVDKRQAVLNVHTHYSDDAALADAKR
jgi:acetolactate synthase I/II/III large subunit